MTAARPDVLLTGAGGFVGSRLREAALALGLGVASSRDGLGRLGLERPGALAELIAELAPPLVIHAAAMADIAACEREPERAERVNRTATLEIARAAAAHSARLVFLSTDQVFDGRAAPYREEAAPAPLHVYGRTKAAAEDAVLSVGGDALILRLPLVLGASRGERRSASDQVLDALVAGRSLALFEDEFRTPAEVRDLAAAVLELALGRAMGLLHLGGPERLSRLEIGRVVARAAGFSDSKLLVASRLAEHPLAASRPPDLGLDSRRAEALLGRRLRPIAEAIL